MAFTGSGCGTWCHTSCTASRVVVPEVEHRLTEVLNNVAAVEINVFHQRPTILAVENDVFPFSGGRRLDHDTRACPADGLGRAGRLAG